MTKTELELLGKRIKQLREKHRGPRSGAVVAREMGVSKTSMTHWERGANAPSVAALLRLAQAIGCKPAEFLEPF